MKGMLIFGGGLVVLVALLGLQIEWLDRSVTVLIGVVFLCTGAIVTAIDERPGR